MIKIEYIIILIITITITRIAFAIITYPKLKGKVGEDIVKYHLGKLNKEEYKVINDVLLKRKSGSTSQIDL